VIVNTIFLTNISSNNINDYIGKIYSSNFYNYYDSLRTLEEKNLLFVTYREWWQYLKESNKLLFNMNYPLSKERLLQNVMNRNSSSNENNLLYVLDQFSSNYDNNSILYILVHLREIGFFYIVLPLILSIIIYRKKFGKSWILVLFGYFSLKEFIIKHPIINFVFIIYLYYSLRDILNYNLFYIDIDINQISVLFIYYLEYFNHIYLHKFMYLYDGYSFNNIYYDVSNKKRIRVSNVLFAVNELDYESNSDKEENSVSNNKSKINNGSSGNQGNDDSDSTKSEDSDGYDEVEALLEGHVDTLKDLILEKKDLIKDIEDIDGIVKQQAKESLGNVNDLQNSLIGISNENGNELKRKREFEEDDYDSCKRQCIDDDSYITNLNYLNKKQEKLEVVESQIDKTVNRLVRDGGDLEKVKEVLKTEEDIDFDTSVYRVSKRKK